MNMLVLIILFIVELAFITLIVLIARSGLKDRINRSLFYFLIVFALWALSNYSSNLTNLGGDQLLVLNRALFAVSIVCIYALQFFVTRVISHVSSHFARLFSAAVALYAIFISCTSGVVDNVFIERSSVVGIGFGALSFSYFMVIVYLGGLIIYRLVHGTRSKSKINSVYSKTLLGSIGIAIGAVLVTNVLIPVVFNDFSFTTIGLLAGILIISGISYGIVRHKMFDIKLAAARGVAYSLVLATLVSFYFVIALLLSSLFNNTFVESSNVVGNLIISLSLVFIFQPIKNFFDKVTNRIFYRDSYSSDKFYAKLNQILSSTTDLRLLLQRTSREIADTLKSEQAFIFTYYKDSRHVMAGTEGHTRLPVRDALELNDYVSSNDGSIIVSELINESKIKRIMISHKLAIVLPLVQNDVTIGYLCLGEHLSSKYNSTDIRVLETISDELVIAIQNALSVEDVRDINATLQQRVDNATKELRASNGLLKHLDEAKDEFVSMASHQLRTPLTSVKGYISMLIEGDAGKITKSQKVLLEEAFNSSERMVRLINDFLNVSRLQTGKFMIDRRPIDLAKVVGQELDSLKTNASSRNLKFSYKAPKNIPIISIDEGKIRQVIMNFSDNALYYSHEKSTIKVELRQEKNDIVFTVKDTGIGVPRSEQAKLFTKFYRASNARKQRPDGTGVGLFMAKKVIDAHGGKVVFESIEGKGSTFGFRLPLDKVLVVDNTN